MTKHHSEEFKKDAVLLVILNNQQIKKGAGELGINHWTLKGGVEKFGKPIRTENKIFIYYNPYRMWRIFQIVNMLELL